MPRGLKSGTSLQGLRARGCARTLHFLLALDSSSVLWYNQGIMVYVSASRFPAVSGIFNPTPISLPFTTLLTHRRVAAKNSLPLFAPAVFDPVPAASCRHSRTGPIGPHRCDASVREVTALVYDADAGTLADIQLAHDLLKSKNISHVFYSSHSYDPAKALSGGKANFRLVVAVDRPVRPEEFKGVRATVLRAFAVPAEETVCAGISHSYYYPSCPPDIEPVTLAHIGSLLPVDEYLGSIESRTSVAYVEIEEYAQPSLAMLRAELEAYLATDRPSDSTRLQFRCVLDGRPLYATEGERHAAVIILRGKLVGRFTDVDPDLLVELVTPCLNALNTDGRDFVAEFSSGLAAYQNDLLASDEAGIEASKPNTYQPPTPLAAGSQPSVVERFRANVLTTRAATLRRRGEEEKAELLTKILKGQSLETLANVNRAAWVVFAAEPNYPLEVYVEVLRPSIKDTVVGPTRLKQILTTAAYKAAE